MCLLYGNSHIIRLADTYTVFSYFVKQYTFNIYHFSFVLMVVAIIFTFTSSLVVIPIFR